MDLVLPYRVGDLAESKSFLEGYRGAWFRCKIHNMRVSEESGHLECYLEYVDYPGEEKEWIKLYQKNPADSDDQNSNVGYQIMIRPSFPQWFFRDQVPDPSPNSNIIAIVDTAWKVGDLVDWLSEGCYWSGTITKLLNKDTVEVELLAPPIGEGKRYPANKDDLRPTLDWSLSKDWTVPLSQAKGKRWHVARLIHQYDSDNSTAGEETSSVDEDGDDDDEGVQQAVSRAASNVPQEAPDSLIPKPPSAANSSASLNTHKEAVLTSMEDLLKSSSTSKPPDPSHGLQAAGSSSEFSAAISFKQEPGTGSFIMQEQDSALAQHQADDVADECLEKLKAVEDKLKHLLERCASGTRTQ